MSKQSLPFSNSGDDNAARPTNRYRFSSVEQDRSGRAPTGDYHAPSTTLMWAAQLLVAARSPISMDGALVFPGSSRSAQGTLHEQQQRQRNRFLLEVLDEVIQLSDEQEDVLEAFRTGKDPNAASKRKRGPRDGNVQ